MEKKYLNEKEVNSFTGIALSTLRNQRSRGEGLPYVKLGKMVRYDMQDILAFMGRHRIETQEQN